MKYTPATIAKALVGGVVAASGVYASAQVGGVDPGEWALILGAGFTGFGAVFATPNKSTEPVQTTAEQVITGMQQAAQDKAAAEDQLAQITQAATAILGNTPLGPLANAIINGHR